MQSNDLSCPRPVTSSPKPATRWVSLVVSLVTVFCLALSFPAELKAESEANSGTSQLVTGASCFLLTPVYGAFKLAFAGAGAVVGGFTWLFTGGDEGAAQRVWDSSLKGTYVITPEHLSGEKQVQFVGPRRPVEPEPRAARAQTERAGSTSN